MAARDSESHVREIGEPKVGEISTQSVVRERLESKMGHDVSTKSVVREHLESKMGHDVSTKSSFIFRAPRELRGVNERAFDPQIISIGPYHHGKPHLKAMESRKVDYLRSLLRQPYGFHLEDYIAAYVSIEKQVRDCYDDDDDDTKLSSADFGEIMVLDGLFVVELIRKFMEKDTQNDSLFKKNLNLSIVRLDLLLLENQLPFCLLEKFASMTGLSKDDFARAALKFFSEMEPRPWMPNEKENTSTRPVIETKEHLLGLVHDNWIPQTISPPEHEGSDSQEVHLNINQPDVKGKRIDWLEDEDSLFIRSATELSDQGIKFGTYGWETCTLFDIEFMKGALYLPTLVVDHDTERIFRNLIAHEQFRHDSSSIVMDYARFMDSLINDAADVALLRKSWIIDNRLGSDEDVAKMINKLNEYVYLSTDNFYYSNIFKKVNLRCNRTWNQWKMKLKQNHFQTPWDWILASIAAATVLLILTVVQTVFTVLPYFKKGAS